MDSSRSGVSLPERCFPEVGDFGMPAPSSVQVRAPRATCSRMTVGWESAWHREADVAERGGGSCSLLFMACGPCPQPPAGDVGLGWLASYANDAIPADDPATGA